MVKRFDREDLVQLWRLVKEKFSSAQPTEDMERSLWVELKRLFEPDEGDILWKLQKYLHDPLVWRLYDTCGVHHVSSSRGHDIFMLKEKDYPLSRGVMTLMLANKLVADEDNEMAIELIRKIFIQAQKAVNLACYVQNRVLVVKPHNKTPYELFHDRTPTLSFMRPFGCPVTILNTIDHLGKFDGKADEGFFIGYSLNSKSFRVFNSKTRIVEENLNIRFSESTPNDVGSGPDWLFDIDALTRTMNNEAIVVGTQFNGFAGTKASDNAGQA
ncbi:ribonuclease H-like domain-containing protein [Tanacetum coccineum]